MSEELGDSHAQGLIYDSSSETGTRLSSRGSGLPPRTPVKSRSGTLKEVHARVQKRIKTVLLGEKPNPITCALLLT